MVMKIMSEDARDIFMECIKEGTSYEITNPIVESGGEDLDTDFHLVLHASCKVKERYGFFASFLYEIRIPFELERGKSQSNGFFGTSTVLSLHTW